VIDSCFDSDHEHKKKTEHEKSPNR
jgi:hypothetical protein